MVSGNAAVLNHRRDGRALRLFDGSRGEVTYMGEFDLDADEPWYETDAPETNDGPPRKVIVFRLRPLSTAPERGQALMPAASPAPLVQIVPVEEQNTERAFVAPSREPYEAERREARLVLSLRDHLRALGHTVGRLRIVPVGEAKPLFADLYDETGNVLVEAKGSVSREAIRMAIGQLADYARFQPGCQRVILLPERPREDLLHLAMSQEVIVVWPIGGSYDTSAPVSWLG
jgi:hypothetical protein